MWTIWTSLSAVRERPYNLITHSLQNVWLRSVINGKEVCKNVWLIMFYLLQSIGFNHNCNNIFVKFWMHVPILCFDIATILGNKRKAIMWGNKEKNITLWVTLTCQGHLLSWGLPEIVSNMKVLPHWICAYGPYVSHDSGLGLSWRNQLLRYCEVVVWCVLRFTWWPMWLHAVFYLWAYVWWIWLLLWSCRDISFLEVYMKFVNIA